MKKINILLTLVALSLALKAQTYTPAGTVVQRAPTSKGYIYRIPLGIYGYLNIRSNAQTDSLISLAAVNANQGLTLSGDTVEFGGTMYKDAVVTVGGHLLNFIVSNSTSPGVNVSSLGGNNYVQIVPPDGLFDQPAGITMVDSLGNQSNLTSQIFQVFNQAYPTDPALNGYAGGTTIGGAFMSMSGGQGNGDMVLDTAQLVISYQKSGTNSAVEIQPNAGEFIFYYDQGSTNPSGFSLDTLTDYLQDYNNVHYAKAGSDASHVILGDGTYGAYSGGGSGTMTSITPGVGFLSHTPITTSGTMDVDTATTVASKTFAGRYITAASTNTLSNKNLTGAGNSFPTFNQATTSTAANLSGTPALPNGTTATTQTTGDNTSKLATDAFVNSSVTADSTSLSANYQTRPIGLIYKTAPTTLTDFTYSGFTPTASNAGITFTGGSNTFTQTMIINGITNNDPNQDIVVGYKIGATGHGLGIGRKSIDIQASLIIQYDETTNALIFTSLQGPTTLATIPANFTVSNNDLCIIRLSQRENVITGTFTDASLTGATFSFAVPLQTAGYNVQIPNTADICLYNIGGTHTVSNISVTSKSLFRPDLILVGDSKVAGFGVFGLPFRWANQLGPLGSVEVYAGGGDKVADMLAAQPYILKYVQPRNVGICVLRNNLSGGTLTSGNKTDYQTLTTNYLVGSAVYHFLPITEESIPDQSAITTFIDATYSSANIIDPSSGVITIDTATMLAVDKIHLNYLGDLAVSTNILHANKIPLSNHVSPFIPSDPIITYPVVYTSGRALFGNGTSTPVVSTNIFASGTFVGINASSPGVALDVSGARVRLLSGSGSVGYQTGVSAVTYGNYVASSSAQFSTDAAVGDNVQQVSSTSEAILFNLNAGAGAAEVALRHTGLLTTVPIKITSATTSVTGSTSGTAVFSQPEAGGTMKIVMIQLTSLIGTASYTYPTAFVNTPVVLTSSGLSGSIATSVSTTAVTCTGTTSTGTLILMGY
jgi:hypothetical protein